MSRPSPLLVLHSEASRKKRSKGKSEAVGRQAKRRASRRGETLPSPTNEGGESGHQEKCIATAGAVGVGP